MHPTLHMPIWMLVVEPYPGIKCVFFSGGETIQVRRILDEVGQEIDNLSSLGVWNIFVNSFVAS